MINVTRTPEVPVSLQDARIQVYINALAAHKEDPANNQKPEKPVSYRNADILDAFEGCFFNKCYLTEEWFPNSYAMDIDHFIPQAEQPDRVYEWTNLYPCEHHANNMKPRTTPAGGYLDPCNPDQDVENEIRYSLSAYGDDPVFEAVNRHNVMAVNTATLLDRLHNGREDNTIRVTKTLRNSIHKRYIEILNKIIDWRRHPEGSQAKYQAGRELKDMLSRKSSFTMLCRSIPAVQELPADFFD